MTTRRAALIGIAVTSYIFMCGNQSNCDRRVPTISCDTTSVTVLPGTCTTITNPCADHTWYDLPLIDGFQLCGGPTGLTTTTQRTGGVTTRQICASPAIGTYSNLSVSFMYARGAEIGLGSILLTTSSPLVVSASATPDTIAAGGTAQLQANVSGGVAPYTYSWVPGTGLSATNIANPTASPTTSTTYTVTVSDAAGQSQMANVLVTVQGGVTVTANPDRIDAFFGSQLSVTVDGGVPPFTYVWVPEDSLDDATSATPTAFPGNTTTYQVTVTDANGTEFVGSVTVIVNMYVDVQAVPDNVNQGNPVQLFAFPSGGLPPYTFTWTPNATLDNPNSDQPIATPIETTTYSVVVEDALGAMVSGNVTVTVNPATGDAPVANFTFTYDGVETLSLNASSSTGTIIRYEWDFSWSPGNPDITSTSPFATWFASPSTNGTITLTVWDQFNRSSTRVVTFP